jgi:type I restriction enzyme R subunit
MSLSEADTRAKLIDPVLHLRGWTEDLIRREETAGPIEILAPQRARRSKGRIDYILRIRVSPGSQPVAVALIEAKPEHMPPGHGLEQAKRYAAACQRLNVPLVFSSNGHLYVGYDRLSGKTSDPSPIAGFPTPDELKLRYEKAVGFSLSDPAARPLLVRYSGGEAVRRYYQDAAIRAVLEKIARCEKSGEPRRALLALATGAGKTFIAVHLLKRIADAGLLRRALFVCDRDELRTQGLAAFSGVFGTDAAEAYRDTDGKNHARNARVHVATYQTLGVAGEADDASFLTENYPPDFFSHIVIDECHRSAWGKWSQVLTRNPAAVQVGLTATPRQLKITEKTKEALQDAEICADNLRHFGEPAYEYTMAQAIEDGYLAACLIQKGRVSLDDAGLSLEEILAHEPVDVDTGLPIAADKLKPLYGSPEFEDKIILPDRVNAMCIDLFDFLCESGGPEQKTIIFCRRDRHADMVAVKMNNLYADWCAKNNRQRLEPYAFKCTSASSGNDQLPDLRGASRHHFVATTVDLLTTGVDVPCVRNIAFFRYLKSPIAFHQMVGRGTRIDLPSGKLMFTVYDYTNATRLFSGDFISRLPSQKKGEPTESLPKEPIPLVEGVSVTVTDAGKFIVTEQDGKAVPITVEEYKERMAARLVKEAPTVEAFRQRWVDPALRRELVNVLVTSGYSPIVVRMVEEMDDYDLYDALAELGYGLAPRTRAARADAFEYKHDAWLRGLPEGAAATLRALAAQFAKGGTEGLENVEVFQTPRVRRAGGVKALAVLGRPAEVLRETKVRLFAA